MLDAFGSHDFFVRDSLLLLVVALSIYLLLNAGLFAVPQVGFMAIGSYTAAVLSTEHEVPIHLTVLAGGVLAALSGLALGAVVARLDGVYLAIATIGFSEIVRVLARNLDLTGGASGIVGVERGLNDVQIVGVVVVVLVVLARFSLVRQGRAVTALRVDSLMASHQGVNPRLHRLVLFTASGAIAGVGGAMHAHLDGFVLPGYFSFDLLINMLAAVVLGGMTSVLGPVVGAVIVFGLPQVLRDVEDYKNVVNGALIVAIVAFAPDGLVDLARRVFRLAVHQTRRGGRQAPPDEAAEPVGAVAAGDVADEVAAVPARPSAGGADGSEPAPVLEVEGATKAFGGVTAVRGVSLTVGAEEIVGLIGPNGSGKTTLLNLLSGVYAPDSGTGRLSGHPLDGAWGRPERVARLGLARTFQNIRLVPEWTVRENVAIGSYLSHGAGLGASLLALPGARGDERSAAEAVDRVLELLGLAAIADADVTALPYGSQRKVEIARALVRRPSLLLLDEPTAGMTPTERDEIFGLTRTVRASGVAVVVVEHDVASITAHCDRVAVLHFGALIAVGRPDEVIREEAVVDAYIGRPA